MKNVDREVSIDFYKTKSIGSIKMHITHFPNINGAARLKIADNGSAARCLRTKFVLILGKHELSRLKLASRLLWTACSICLKHMQDKQISSKVLHNFYFLIYVSALLLLFYNSMTFWVWTFYHSSKNSYMIALLFPFSMFIFLFKSNLCS